MKALSRRRGGRAHEPAQFGRNLRIVSIATALSRVTGYIRDMINAHLFGASLVSDAFFAANRIPTFMQNMVADGVFAQAFVPTFSKILARKKRKEAMEFVSQMFTLVLAAGGVLTLLGVLFADKIVYFTAFGFTAQPAKFELAARLTAILFPVFLLACLASYWMGILNSLHRFTMPALATVAMNAVLILVGLGLMLAKATGHDAGDLAFIHIWALAVLPGMFLQWAIQWPEASRLGFRPRLAWPSHPAIREALALMAFALVSQSVIQLNFVVNQFFASFLPNGFVSYLYYGNRLMLLPFGVLGVAIATVSFPLLSRQAGPGQDAKFNRTITRSLGSALYFTLPATVGLILLASPVSRLAFQHGAFTAEDTRWVTRAVALYMLGLPGNTGTKILITVYYAKNRPRWSLWAALTSFLTNLAVNGSLFLAALSPGIRLNGIILAAGISSTVNLCILLGGLPRVGVKVNWNWLGREALGVLAATLLMGLATWGALQGLEFLRLPYGNLWMSLLPAALGAWVYLLVTRRWGLESSGTILRRGA